MDKTFHSKSCEVNECLKYPELASIDSNLLKEINKFIIYADYDGKEVFLITHSDEVYAFGSNIEGILGFGHTDEVKEPTFIPELSGKNVNNIKCGDLHSVALTQSKQIYTFGFSYSGRTGNGNNRDYQKPTEISVDNQSVIAIDCTGDSTFVLTQSGQLYWFGEFNDNTVYIPTKVVFPSEVNIESISCGLKHILALNVDGNVFSWGDNEYGQLGLGHYNGRDSPKMIESNENIKQIYCGKYHSLLLATNGKLYSMGYNFEGQLGIGNKKKQKSPQFVLSEQKEICCFRDISMSLDKSNKFYIWGNIISVKGVESPFVTGLTSFQEVLNTYAEQLSTLKTIELLKPKNCVIKTTTKLFNNPENFDFKFKVKSKQSSEYKEIYCQKCFIKETNEYFQRMFANKWKENKTNELEINEYSYEAYYLYLKSLYTDIIDTEDMDELLEILSITDQYMDSDRKDECVELIKEKTNIENVCSVYSSSIKFNCINLKEYAFEIMAGNMTDLIQTCDYENMDPIYAKQFLTEFH